MSTYYHKFNTKEAEDQAAQQNGISSPYISIVDSPKSVNFGYKKGNVALGNFLHIDGTINSVPKDDIIGVCVIASNFLPDGKARFVSLKSIDGSSRGNSEEDKDIYWGTENNANYTGEYYPAYNNNSLVVQNDKAYDRVPVDTNMDGVLDMFDQSSGQLPIGKSSNPGSGWIANTKDSGTYYRGNTVTNKIPSPYGSDGKLNPNYMFKGSIMGHRNCFQDIYGERNTETLVKHYQPCIPALYCRRFSPGYKNNKWYLPAVGELGFIPPRFDFIVAKMQEAINAGSEGVVLSTSSYWSSSEWDSESAWNVAMGNGYVGGSGKDSSYCVQAFLAS